MKTKNSLPKYWVVQADQSNPNWKKVIDYLHKVHGEKWGGDVDGSYYGYDGGSCWNGTNVYNTISEFRNSPVVLTIEEFVEMTEGNVFPKYVKCINSNTASMHQKYTGKSPEVGKIYKVVETSYPEKGACVLTHVTECGVTVYTHATKPSTKEAFDKQQQKSEETMKTITHTQAQQIIDIACSKWKNELFDHWGKSIVLKRNIVITDEEYQRMRKACTFPQNELFDEIFGKDKPTFKIGDWVYAERSDDDWRDEAKYIPTFQIKEFSNCGGYARPEAGKTTGIYVSHLRLATEEEIQKAQYIPKGTPCLVRDGDSQPWKFSYSNGNGEFKWYEGQENGHTWKQVQVLDINNLPKY